MTSLVEFLEQRIAEDEAMVPERFRGEDFGGGFNSEDFLVEVSCIRWLAECAAKRAIIALHPWQPFQGHDRYGRQRSNDLDPKGFFCGECQVDDGVIEDLDVPCPTLRILAAPYASHPDFDSSWVVETP